jgi:hypothetical protein
MDIDKLISDKKFWTTIKVRVKVMQPAVMVLCYSDGIHGGNLGLMYMSPRLPAVRNFPIIQTEKIRI